MSQTIAVTNANDSGAGSLRQKLATAEAGDTIIFDDRLANKTITLTSGQLDIDRDLIIDGGDATGLTISGNNASRVFETGHRTNVTFRNLTIANGKTTQSGEAGNGGAIRTGFQTILTVENSIFNNNVTSGQGGGAIWAGTESNTTIINSKFDGNDATAGQAERGGGAISTSGLAVLTVQNSEFTNNKGINGGAINTPSTALTVEKSTFINNDTTAGAFTPTGNKGLGGAIYTDGVSASFGGDNGSIIIRDSLLENNKGAGGGGAAFLFTYPGDNVVIENTRVLNNSVTFNDQNFAHGGGIRLGTGNSSAGRTAPVRHDITNTTFAGNTAGSQGGGLWVQQQLDLTRVNIVNSTFSDNKTESQNAGLGGAIVTLAPTTITNSTIASNHSANLSGAIHTNESAAPHIEVTNTIFDRNTAGNEFGIAQQTRFQLIDGGGNLQFPGVGGNAEAKVTANIKIGNPQLGELQEINGALVHPLQAGSRAIDAGTNTNAPTTDQRGQKRPIDGDGNGSEVTDIGAYEFVEEVPSGLNLRGTDKADRLVGGANRDTLTGAGGRDTLIGRGDRDLLRGGRGNDILNGGGGRDTLSGGRGNDTLTGGTGRDILTGHRGRDRLNGNAGNDTLTGGLGSDRFIFNTNQKFAREELGRDVITDFNGTSGDRILLNKRTFTKLTSEKGSGFSADSEFETVDSNAAAAASDAVIVYNQTNGNLFYNPNGSNKGLGSGGLFATLTDGPALEESDFLVR